LPDADPGQRGRCTWWPGLLLRRDGARREALRRLLRLRPDDAAVVAGRGDAGTTAVPGWWIHRRSVRGHRRLRRWHGAGRGDADLRPRIRHLEGARPEPVALVRIQCRRARRTA